VLVFITSCQVSENLKSGPEIIQAIIIKNATENAAELPKKKVALVAKRSNQSFNFCLIISHTAC
jgi:hypothetical protein